MNEVLKAIKSRRSTRAFTGAAVPPALLQEVLEAGRWAPSAHNQQSWHFTVVGSQALLDEVDLRFREAAKDFQEEFIHKLLANANFHIFYHAPVAIFISARENALLAETDCAAATQNMLLAAESLGLGSCWIGFAGFPFLKKGQNQDLLQKLAIPEGYRPLYAVVLGYKRVEAVRGPRRKEEWVTFHSPQEGGL